MKKHKSNKKKQLNNQPTYVTQNPGIQAESHGKPILRFSPTAWAKLLYFRDKTDNEIGGFGISEAEDLLYVRQFITVKQQVSAVSVKFEDEAVAGLFDRQVDLGRKPEQFARIWCHSHPFDSPQPSGVDEETFSRVFGDCQWAVMFILAGNNSCYARLSFNVGPGCQVLIPVEVDYSPDFGPSDKEAWDSEYQANVRVVDWLDTPAQVHERPALSYSDYSGLCLANEFLDELEHMAPSERRFILDELAERPELWDEESEVSL